MSVRVLDGDCLAVMPTLEASSVDAIVCDPPYGLSFMGKAWDHGVPGVEFWTAALGVAKPGAYLVAFGGTRTYHRLTCAIEDAGWEIRDCLSWLYGSGFPKSHNGAWGGTALKPAWEPIILARKPLIGTVAANHAEHGTAGLNIDGCRIATEPGANLDGGRISSRAEGWDRPWKHDSAAQAEARKRGDASVAKAETLGRWPANVALDEEAARLLDAQSGELTSGKWDGKRSAPKTAGIYGAFAHGMQDERGAAGDTGGASRFFYTAKAGRQERDAGLDGFDAKPAGAVKSGDGGFRNEEARGRKPRHDAQLTARNHHPTVKPLDLMQWLCRLVTPKGGLILDPFCGSGSTGRAAIAEGFSFIGIELSPEYAEIARARIAEYAPLFGDVA